MKATDFECRHQTLLHLLLVGVAVSLYFFDRDDIVWALVRHHSNSALLEQATFGAGTLMLLGCAVLETWASAYAPSASSVGPLLTCDGPYRYFQYPLLVSRLLFALVLGLLVPLPGTVVIVGGEAFLVSRLFARVQPRAPVRGAHARWGQAFRWTAAKWGFLASMMVFTWTRQDRIAEIGGGLSFLVWFALNFPRLVRSHDA
jgi:protein-S-isoprenylcysteine O-methyltransferase Ste14